MFKTTSKKLNHIERVASAATREHANGRIDLIPKWAKEPEEYYNGLKEQMNLLREQVRKAHADMEKIALMLRPTLGFKEFSRWDTERKRVAAILAKLNTEIQQHRELLIACGNESWACVFYACAKMMLDADSFQRIDDETANVLQRRHREFKTKEQIHHLTQRHNEKERRAGARAKYSKDPLVWSDEKNIRPGHAIGATHRHPQKS